jgi:hypothetical protein
MTRIVLQQKPGVASRFQFLLNRAIYAEPESGGKRAAVQTLRVFW